MESSLSTTQQAPLVFNDDNCMEERLKYKMTRSRSASEETTGSSDDRKGDQATLMEPIQDGNNYEGEEDSSIDTTASSSQSQQLSDVMESIVKVSLAGLGGTIVGLSLENRMSNLRVTTPAGMTAEARRKRFSPVLSQPRSSFNLPLTWGIACTVFVSLIEISRFVSLSTILIENVWLGSPNWQKKDDGGDGDGNASSSSSSPPSSDQQQHDQQIVIQCDIIRSNPTIKAFTTVADYTLGGAVAGIAGSFGQKRSRRTNSTNINIIRGGVRPFHGLVPGIGLGLLAGCLQAAVDYGVSVAEKKRQEHA
jgi:hypothetical protein